MTNTLCTKNSLNQTQTESDSCRYTSADLVAGIESWSARSRSLLLQPLRSLGEARREHELSRGA